MIDRSIATSFSGPKATVFQVIAQQALIHSFSTFRLQPYFIFSMPYIAHRSVLLGYSSFFSAIVKVSSIACMPISTMN